jgi:hypothetical protein
MRAGDGFIAQYELLRALVFVVVYTQRSSIPRARSTETARRTAAEKRRKPAPHQKNLPN